MSLFDLQPPPHACSAETVVSLPPIPAKKETGRAVSTPKQTVNPFSTFTKQKQTHTLMSSTAAVVPLFSSIEARQHEINSHHPSHPSQLTVSLECSPYIVDLRTAWKTSHSVSTQRKNALITAVYRTCRSQSKSADEDEKGIYKGYGEVGMPPKNPKAGYFADYDDVHDYTAKAVIANSPYFSSAAAGWLLGTMNTPPEGSAPPNAVVTPLPSLNNEEADVIVLLVALLRLHDTRRCSQGDDFAKAERFGRSGVEGAIVDILARLLGVPSFVIAEAWVKEIFKTMRGGCDGDMPVKEYLIDMSLFKEYKYLPAHEKSTAAGDGDGGVSSEDRTFIPLGALCFFYDRFVKKFIASVKEIHSAATATSATAESKGKEQYKGFLTVGMADPEAMSAGVREALTQTRFIKIKLDGNETLTYDRLFSIGKAINEYNTTEKCRGGDESCGVVELVIDANCAWTPEITTRFAENMGRLALADSDSNSTQILVSCASSNENEASSSATASAVSSYTSPFSSSESLRGLRGSGGKSLITLVEQPYAADFISSASSSSTTTSLLEEWASAKVRCNEHGIKLFADESVCSADDLPALVPYINGINIKLEKCGGLLSAFEFVKIAEAVPTIDFTWVGIMVGTRLLCNNAGQLLTRTKQGDVDGALLLTEASQLFSGGFEWMAEPGTSRHGTIVLSANSVGVGCDLKH